ncbi:UAA transporter [Auriculariales sp. MPI-PUGE-AT-0066]|nr:UAA transporter [Auriculariales sp. MPI-PUGE-AT-0066]
MSAAVVDTSGLAQPLTLVFGGCCSNAWSLEQMLTHDARLASALTLIQMLFTVLHSLPAVLSTTTSTGTFTLKLRPRAVPLREWAAQVVVLTAMSLLNGWVFLYPVPVTIQIIFRSAALIVSMVFNFIFNDRRYTLLQMVAVSIVSTGIVVSTLAKPGGTGTGSKDASAEEVDTTSYLTGIGLLSLALIMAGVLGILQERTFAKYGPHWREGLFYTHVMSAPLIASTPGIGKSIQALRAADLRTALPVLVLNVLTQSVCVAGVNQLMSRVSSVSTNIVLTTRKALSLCISVWYFGAGWNAQLGLGAGLVGVGTVLYAVSSSAPHKDKKAKKQKKVKVE